MILKRKLEKQEINALPLKAYDGEIFIDEQDISKYSLK